MNLSKIRNLAIEIKILISRSTGYLAIANTGMILYIFLEQLATKGTITFDLGQWAIPIYIGTILLFIGLGALEIYVLKGAQQEAARSYELNPVFMDMKGKIDTLHARLEK